MNLEVIAIWVGAIAGIIAILGSIFKSIQWLWKKYGNQIHNWFSNCFLTASKLWQFTIAGCDVTAKQISNAINRLRKMIDLRIFTLKGRKMQANLEQPVQRVLEIEGLSRDEKLTLLTIALYRDGSDTQGLPIILTANPAAVKNCFLQMKNANLGNYELLCGRLAIHIMKENEAKSKEDETNYQTYKIPWEGILEPFFKEVLDK